MDHTRIFREWQSSEREGRDDALATVMKNPRLRGEQKLLWLWLWVNAAGQPGTLHTTAVEIAHVFGKCERSAQRWLDSLAHEKLVTVLDRLPNGQWQLFVNTPDLSRIKKNFPPNEPDLFAAEARADDEAAAVAHYKTKVATHPTTDMSSQVSSQVSGSNPLPGDNFESASRSARSQMSSQVSPPFINESMKGARKSSIFNNQEIKERTTPKDPQLMTREFDALMLIDERKFASRQRIKQHIQRVLGDPEMHDSLPGRAADLVCEHGLSEQRINEVLDFICEKRRSGKLNPQDVGRYFNRCYQRMAATVGVKTEGKET